MFAVSGWTVVVNIQCFNGHLSGGPGLAGTRYQNVSILDFIEQDDGGAGDNWSY